MATCPRGKRELGRTPKAWEIFPNTCRMVRSVHPRSKTNLLIRHAPVKAAVGDGLVGEEGPLWTERSLTPLQLGKNSMCPSAFRSKAPSQVLLRVAQSLVCLFSPLAYSSD